MSRPVVAYLTYCTYFEIEDDEEQAQIEDKAYTQFYEDTHPEVTFDIWEYAD